MITDPKKPDDKQHIAGWCAWSIGDWPDILVKVDPIPKRTLRYSDWQPLTPPHAAYGSPPVPASTNSPMAASTAPSTSSPTSATTSPGTSDFTDGKPAFGGETTMGRWTQLALSLWLAQTPEVMKVTGATSQSLAPAADKSYTLNAGDILRITPIINGLEIPVRNVRVTYKCEPSDALTIERDPDSPGTLILKPVKTASATLTIGGDPSQNLQGKSTMPMAIKCVV